VTTLGAAEQLTHVLTRLKEPAARSENGVYSDAQGAPLEAERQAQVADHNQIRVTSSNGTVLSVAAKEPLAGAGGVRRTEGPPG
jgi:hypothetical protein